MTIVRQLSSQRALDAYENPAKDYRAVTRRFQGNTSQDWKLIPVCGVTKLQQLSTGRFLDAHSTDGDFSVVTRTAQDNATQLWVIHTWSPHVKLVQQISSSRFLDAFESASNVYGAVTRPLQEENAFASQLWDMREAGEKAYHLKQLSTGSTSEVNARYLDAYESDAGGFRAVTRPFQNDDSQKWRMNVVGGVYRIMQMSSGRFLDAYPSGDHGVVTRPKQQNSFRAMVSQLWTILFDDGLIRHAASGRLLDAHQSDEEDYRLVTRLAQDNFSQIWTFDQAPPRPKLPGLDIESLAPNDNSQT